jgi:bidirectional [NiFe] hydrogenase diaphorase subunit
MIEISVDGKRIMAEEGQSLLQTCLKNEIYIPNLCYLERMEEPTGSCRLCFVEIEGSDSLSPSCKTIVVEGMVVRTDTPSVRQIQKVIFQLLFSAHHMACRHCLSKKHCELQKIAKLLGVRLKATKIDQVSCDLKTRLRNPCLELMPDKCILCRKCLFVCGERNPRAILTIVKDGTDQTVGFAAEYDEPVIPCSECRACVEVCPVSAIVPKGETDRD